MYRGNGSHKNDILAWILPNTTDVPQKGSEELTEVLGNGIPGVKTFLAVRGRKSQGLALIQTGLEMLLAVTSLWLPKENPKFNSNLYWLVTVGLGKRHS